MFKTPTSCRTCKSESLYEILDLGLQPPANAFLKIEDIGKEQTFPLRLVMCKACGFVQLGDVVDPDILFRDYVYESSTSPVFVRHFKEYADRLFDGYLQKGDLAVDIGSNDGILLRPLRDLGARVLGVDPARGIAERATADGLETLPEYFIPSIAEEIKSKYGQASSITANNVFAHTDDLDELLEAVRLLLSDDGVFVVEAPYLADFIKQRLFDTIYHEHLSYLSLRPLVALFARHGLRFVDVEKTDSHGGSVRMFVAHIHGPHKPSVNVQEWVSREESDGLQKRETLDAFAKAVVENKEALRDLLKGIRKEGGRIVGYGAPAKGNTLLNYMEIGTDLLEYIVDDSPLKQGLVTPGMHIPVVSSDLLKNDAPEYLLILAWNFARPIMEKNKDFQAQGGKFIVPVPDPTIVP